MTQRRSGVFLVPVLILSILLTACGNSENQAISDSAAPAYNANGELMIDHLDFGAFGGGSNPQVNYNPFSPNALSTGYTFEPLMAINSYSCEMVPWLATKAEWKDPQNLVVTIRDGVQWNDKQPFSADD